MKKIIKLNKKEGETPLEVLKNFRAKNKKYKDVKMTYAGRLDPMASGVLLVLIGEETKNKEKYLVKEKEYDFDVLFGFSTDTYDILGKITHSHILKNMGMKDLEKEIKTNLKSFIGESIQKYPIYSSKTVNGKPLFSYARRGENVEIPERKILVRKLKLIKIKQIDNKKLFGNINRRVKKVNGDFRQKEILKIWEEKLLGQDVKHSVLGRKFLIASFKVKCSSGTYVRNIADSLGNKIKIPALAFSIKRTKIC